MIKVIKDCITQSDLEIVNNYLSTAYFNTKENHIPLHNNLFDNSVMDFGITTYGDMGKEISFIFSKISDAVSKATSEISKKEYGQAIVTKSYIMKFENQKELDLGFDQNRPNDVFRSMIFWNKNIQEINVYFIKEKLNYNLAPGDIIVFPETENFIRKVTHNTEFPVFISDFWNAPKGQSPYPGLKYEDVAWGNPMYDKID